MSVDISPYCDQPMYGETIDKLGARMIALRKQREGVKAEWHDGDLFTIVLDGQEREGKFGELTLDGYVWMVHCTWMNKGTHRWGTTVSMKKFCEGAVRKG